MITVITYGTFDLFHVGHVRLLRRLKALGDKLIVGCSSDEFNRLKGKNTVIGYLDRVEILESCQYVDQVFPENGWDQKRSDIIGYKADIFAMGDDWAGKFDELGDICRVVYVPRTAHVSSTAVKGFISTVNRDVIQSVRLSLEGSLAKLDELI